MSPRSSESRPPAKPDRAVWWHLLASPAAPELTEVVAELLREHARQGVVIDSEGSVGAYFLERSAAAAAAAALADLVTPPEISAVPESGWANWRRAFKPVSAGERLRIYPPWLAGPATAASSAAGRRGAARLPRAAEIPLVIEPGLAFGTGDHPTTAACLAYLERTVLPGQSLLDVGTGSGVLAIAAAVLGASPVLAIDVDPTACRAAFENLDRNPAARDTVEVSCRDAADLGGLTADVVVANLVSQVLIRLAATLAGCVAPGGALIVSGIGSDQRNAVALALGEQGFSVRSQTLERAWVTMLMRRRAGDSNEAGRMTSCCPVRSLRGE